MNRRFFLKAALASGVLSLVRGLGFSIAYARTALFSDSFARTSTTSGWGGPWFSQRYGMDWGISNSKGYYKLPPPQGSVLYNNPNPVLVLDKDVADLDLRTTFSSSNANARFGLLGRARSYGDYYAAFASGSSIKIARISINRETVLATAPFSIAARKPYTMRFKITGRDPVVLKAKIWPARKREPAEWTVVRRHRGRAKIGGRGPFGLFFAHDPVKRNAAAARIDEFHAVSPQRPSKTKPRITFAFTGPVREEGRNFGTQLVAKSDVPSDIVFHVGSDPDLKNHKVLSPTEVMSKAGVAKARLGGLAAGAVVYWRAVARTSSGSTRSSTVRSVRTPALGQPVKFAFGSCTNPFPHGSSFSAAAATDPDFYVHLGDLGYPHGADLAALALREDFFQDRWTRILARSHMQRLHRISPWIMLQDDHDYGENNCWSQTVQPFTVPAFDELSGNNNARYFDLRYGDVHCFVVEGRLYADDPNASDGPAHSILGATQKTWLKQAMQTSDAKLLVVLSPRPFWGPGRGLGWRKGYAYEREELISFFASLQGTNRRVIICSGGAHAQYVSVHPDPNGIKDIYEFTSSGTDRDGYVPSKFQGKRIDPTRAILNKNAFGSVEFVPSGDGGTAVIRCLSSRSGMDVWKPLALTL